MKCLVLAGGMGENLWPLSRNDFPKQFIALHHNHSLFQETIARNIQFCDEFIIVTNEKYRNIVRNQMRQFQGVTYRLVLEEAAKGTGVAIAMGCMNLEPAELVLVVPSDHLIEGVNDYREAIISAKQKAVQGKVVLFGVSTEIPDPRYGWLLPDAKGSVDILEHPSAFNGGTESVLHNTGIMVFENGNLLEILSKSASYSYFAEAHRHCVMSSSGYLYDCSAYNNLARTSIEKLIDGSNRLYVLAVKFSWCDIGSVEDISFAHCSNKGLALNKGSDCLVLNTCEEQAVVLENADNIMVINTPDAVYVSKRGASLQLKDTIAKYDGLKPFIETSNIVYRPWGYYEKLSTVATHSIRRVHINSGKTIYAHMHEKRSETWTVVQGQVLVTIDGKALQYSEQETVSAPPGTMHQISNIGLNEAILIEIACGDVFAQNDLQSKPTPDITEYELGFHIEPIIRLTPAYKETIWGGRRLYERYRFHSDYARLAECWLMSAHKDGQSVVAAGRHQGVQFRSFLEMVGENVLGWKCGNPNEFPLLVKLIDAVEDLSVQVHPDDEYALMHAREFGKNEMWYIIDSAPGSVVYAGFNRDIGREEFQQRIQDNTILEVLNAVETHPGDVIFIPAGTVHAIGAGNLIYEVQQNSNTTYRIYDYDRCDKYGNKRELHLKNALEVMSFQKYDPKTVVNHGIDGVTKLVECKYFTATLFDISGVREIPVDSSCFLSVTCIDGSGYLMAEDQSERITAGDSFFIGAQEMALKVSGSLKLIVTHV